jgi:hypothetical protein
MKANALSINHSLKGHGLILNALFFAEFYLQTGTLGEDALTLLYLYVK